MLRISDALHRADCAANGVEFKPVYGRSATAALGRSPHWEKCWLLYQALLALPANGLAVWTDADVLKISRDDWRAALPAKAELGMVRSESCGMLNAGVIVARNTPRVRELFDASWARGPEHAAAKTKPYHDQPVINALLKEEFKGLDVVELDGRWNWYQPRPWDNGELPAAVVLGWHGLPRETARRRMCEAAFKLTQDESYLRRATT